MLSFDIILFNHLIKLLFKNTILITGATGGMGNYALEFLKKLVPQDEVFTLVRNKEKASQLEEKGFNIRFGKL